MAGPSARGIHLTLLSLYLAVAAVFVGLIGRGITLSIIEEMGLGAGQASRCGARTSQSCQEELVDLRRELDVKLAEIERTGGSRAERLWDEWSAGWRRELGRVAGECCLDQTPVPEGFRTLALAERDLRQLEALYTTHVVQYAREIGDKAEAVDRELGLTAPAPPPRSAPARP
ncbi:MAG TPA: hypothetical protein VMB50_11225 [Myxococcales bacterium]|nr:hypothetical protein [Myxococcales bacterium]